MLAKLPWPGRALRSAPVEAWLGSGAALCLLWVYWPTLASLWHTWGNSSQYSHGYLVPGFALYLLYARKGLMPSVPLRASWWGLALLLGGLAVRFAGTYLFVDWIDGISLLPCLAGLAVLLGGWKALRWSWPAIAFLGFMIPLPYRAEVALAGPLQRIATLASTYVLQTLGFAAFSEGNVIRMGDVRIGVVEACSGLSMLLIFFALTTAVAIMMSRPLPEKILVFLSAVPIALLSNVIRIVVTGIIHKQVGREWADWVHDNAGFLMMPLALGFLWIELRLLSWVIVRVPVADRGPAFLNGAGSPHRNGALPHHRRVEQPLPPRRAPHDPRIFPKKG